MKVRNYILLAIAAAGIAGAPMAAAQSPGPVIAGSCDVSSLPAKAQTFLDTYFKGVGIVKCEREYADGLYDVDLANGVEIEFDNDGVWVEVEAPARGVLDDAIVKATLPDKAYRHLHTQGQQGRVEKVKVKTGGRYKVETNARGIDTFVYSPDGVLILMED